MRGKLYTSCVRGCMLHGSETWPMKKENEMTLQRTEMRMIRWMCSVKVTERFSCSELTERVGIDSTIITTIQQHRLQWYGQLGMF